MIPRYASSTRIAPLLFALFALFASVADFSVARASSDDKTKDAKTNSTSSSAAAYLSTIEAEVIKEINFARTAPQKYAAYLEELRARYSGKEYRVAANAPARITVEGLAALDEAIAYLRVAKPLPPINASQGMTRGARDHCKDLSATNSTGHKGSDGNFVDARVNRYGEWTKAIGENIAYGEENARDVVLGMLIDDGNPKRGHRQNIFNPNYGFAGVSLSGRTTQGALCVINFAGAFIENPVSDGSSSNKPVAKKF